MKELEKKDAPQVSGGDTTSSTPVTGLAYPILQLPDPGQPVDALIVPEQPLP